MIRGNPISELVWLVWFVWGVSWELIGVSPLGRRWGIEPLTHIVRDRLFHNRLGELFVFLFIGFVGWLVWHWTVKRGPRGEVPGTNETDDYDDEPDRA